MHGRLRSEMRNSINDHCAKTETLRELGKTKLVLKSILRRMGDRQETSIPTLPSRRHPHRRTLCTHLPLPTVVRQHPNLRYRQATYWKLERRPGILPLLLLSSSSHRCPGKSMSPHILCHAGPTGERKNMTSHYRNFV